MGAMDVRALLLSSVLTAGAIASACGGTKPAVTSPTPDQSSGLPSGAQPVAPSCAANSVQWTIGQQGTRDLLERARVAANASVARFLRPNEPITMEYLGSRLNLELDARNFVRSARCG